MKNVIILGSGRSGTSMVTGTLVKAGYFMGDDLWKAREANPKGFFEDREINSINEELLAPLIPPRIRIPASHRLKLPIKHLRQHQPIRQQRWLACIPVNASIPISVDLAGKIQKITAREPYCLKDPRFSYTLPAWKPYLKDTVFVCVFRDPASTSNSILKECSGVWHLSNSSTGIRISRRRALQIWTLMYQHILEKHYPTGGKWLFMHYNQALTSEGLSRLESFVQAPVDYSFPNPSIRRTFSREQVPKKANQIYQELCKLAEYEDLDF
ncbi:hypothetical protein XM38_025210 [Halomicronema hongdechloris C2206]|uniref:Sulfotransferase family protein n=1 Tax=Halomicronema hongdechloris C2206 TaxID=1641165 RepID=A0A1Z3HMN9_9CYAN|nr:sulfotransferase [Halomicronema hongdechloris]ASC71569.1 hypothetical protein XM38_025210 [Halomicronema hongdechloris C2206]